MPDEVQGQEPAENNSANTAQAEAQVAETQQSSQAEQTQQEQQVFSADYVSALRGESASYRTKAKEAAQAAEEAKKQAETVTNSLEAATAKTKELEAEKAELMLKYELANDVQDAEVAVKLAKDGEWFTDEGTFRKKEFLEKYPFLRKTPNIESPPANGGNAQGLTAEAVSSPEDYAKWKEQNGA